MNVKRQFFILSTGRAGSKMLAKSLARHPQVFAIHEPLPHLNAEAFAYWNGHLTEKKIKKSVDNKRSKLVKQVSNNRTVYIESSHYCSYLAPILDELYNSKFIFLYRDGRNFVRSGLERENWYPEKAFKHPKNGFGEILRRQIRRRFLIDVGYSWDDHQLIPPKMYTSRMEKISWLWNEINSEIFEFLATLPADKHMFQKLENLNRDAFKEIVSFIDVESSDKILDDMISVSTSGVNKTVDRRVPKFDNWQTTDREKFWKISGNMMEKLGYV